MDLEKQLNECDKLYENMDYKGLIKKCDEILEDYPDNPNAMGYKGISHCFLGEYDEALNILRKGVELYPDNYYLNNNLAMVYYDLGEYEKSLKCCEDGLKIRDFDWLCENKLKALIKLDRMDEAFEFDRTFDHDFNLGEVLLHEEMYGEALEYYYGKLRDSPDDLYVIENIKWIIAERYPDQTPEVGDYYLEWIDSIKPMEKTEVCPDCGGELIPIVYGFPSPEIMEKAERGEVSLGGCVLPGFGNYHCKSCNEDFNLVEGAVRIECENPKLKQYVNFKMFSLDSILESGSMDCADLDELKKRLMTFDDMEFDAFISHLVEIGHLAQPKEGCVKLLSK